jgi:hypothetical protein
MKIKTSELSRAALHWAVAKAACTLHKDALLGEATKSGWWITGCYTHDPNEWLPLHLFTPSTNWLQGGPIILREKLDPRWLPKQQLWCVYAIQHATDGFVRGAGFGPTFLIAAMRCYVASKLGDEVEVPDELCREPA